MTGSYADRPIPRDASIVERVLGLGLFGGVVLGMTPMLIDAHDGGFAGPLVTAPLYGLGLVIAALVFAGPRGRDRFSTGLFESNRRMVGVQGGYRLYRQTGDKERRLRKLGGDPLTLALLAIGALVLVAKPVITPHVEGFASAPVMAGPPGMPPISDAERAELEAAAAAGDPAAIAVRAMLGASAPAVSSHFTIDGYTAERNIAWPLTGLVLLLVAVRLLLTTMSLSPREAG